MLYCLGKKVKENGLCFQYRYIHDFWGGEECLNHACKYRFYIYIIFYIFNNHIIIYKIIVQLYKWKPREVVIYPKIFQEQ